MFAVAQKEIIDQIKSLRRQLMKDVAYSAISRREAERNSLLDYIFPSKKKAKAELQRLAAIVEQVIEQQIIYSIDFMCKKKLTVSCILLFLHVGLAFAGCREEKRGRNRLSLGSCDGAGDRHHRHGGGADRAKFRNE